MPQNKIELFADKKDCCGCSACQNVCPCNAIIMKKDEWGFFYPQIEDTKCIRCGQCMKACAFLDRDDRDPAPIAAYAAASKNHSVLKRSTSGGVFAELANQILMQGGIVFGCAYGDDLTVQHIEVSSAQDLHKLQGSKYVQSNTTDTFSKAKQYLDNGKTVLYSGAPCQIAALRKFLKKDYPNFYCIDIVCHGVGSPALFESDIKYLAKNNAVLKIDFRDKEHGWGTAGTIITEKRKIKFDPIHSAYYYYYYLGNSIYRESCYNCRYPSEKRPGDLTLGDYWRIESAHPGIERTVDLNRGISCVLVNTAKGKCLVDYLKDTVFFVESEYEKIKNRNGQLMHCCNEPELRTRIFEIFKNQGYLGVAAFWKKNTRKQRLLLKLKKCIPNKLKTKFKKHLI